MPDVSWIRLSIQLTDMIRVEEQLWSREALVAHEQDLFLVIVAGNLPLRLGLGLLRRLCLLELRC